MKVGTDTSGKRVSLKDNSNDTCTLRASVVMMLIQRLLLWVCSEENTTYSYFVSASVH